MVFGAEKLICSRHISRFWLVKIFFAKEMLQKEIFYPFDFLNFVKTKENRAELFLFIWCFIDEVIRKQIVLDSIPFRLKYRVDSSVTHLFYITWEFSYMNTSLSQLVHITEIPPYLDIITHYQHSCPIYETRCERNSSIVKK